jgi:hypothetical protein
MSVAGQSRHGGESGHVRNATIVSKKPPFGLE